MDVFLIPVGRDEYELYYEPTDEHDSVPTDEPESPGFFRKWIQRFREMLREAEQQRHRPDHSAPRGMLARAHRRMMRFVVERISEWRLSWHLRSADIVTAHVPADMHEGDADRRIRAMLKTDADRHLRWVIVNILLLAASAPLMLVPGPNVFAYLFTFNVVGHFLAMRGARRGLNGVTWRIVPTAALSELRAALALEEPHRQRTVHAVASQLGLQHLARFFLRIAVPIA